MLDKSLSYIVLPLSDIDKLIWNSFIYDISDATFFSSTDYFDAFDEVFFILAKDQNNKIIAGLPMIIRESLPGIGGFFKTCTLESAILCDYSLNNTDLITVKQTILQVLLKFLKTEGVGYCYISHWIRSIDAILFQEAGFKRQQEGTVIIDLTLNENEIVKNFKSGYRHALNKAKRLGVTYKISEGHDADFLLKDFCQIRLLTQQKAKKKNKGATMMLKTEMYIRKILASKYNKTYIATAYYNNQIAHIVLFVTMKNTIYAYLSGSNVELNRKSGAANYLYYRTIFFAKSIGLKYLDMGGTPINPDLKHPAYGVYFFKRSFGGELKIYDGGYIILKKFQGFILLKLINNRSIVRFFYNLLNFTKI